MNDIIAKLKETGNTEAFNSREEFTAAAKSLGYSDEDINAAVGSINFPLSDDELEAVAGGFDIRRVVKASGETHSYFVRCAKCGKPIKGCNSVYISKSAAEAAIGQLPTTSLQGCSAGDLCMPEIVDKSDTSGIFY